MKSVFIFCCVFGILNDHFGACKLSGKVCLEPESGTEFCCTDYYGNNNGICIECDEGFTTTYGEKPCKKCPFPYYGKRCTYACNCTRKRCDHVKGCVKNTVTTPQGCLEETTTQKNNDTSVLYILYSGGGFLVVFGLLLLIASGIRFKLRNVKKNAHDKQVTIQDEHPYAFIVEANVARQISNKNNEENCPYLPPPDVSLFVPLDLNEENEYDYTYNADGYLNPYDGLKIPDFKDHFYNEMHKQSEKINLKEVY